MDVVQFLSLSMAQFQRKYKKLEEGADENCVQLPVNSQKVEMPLWQPNRLNEGLAEHRTGPDRHAAKSLLGLDTKT